MIQHDIENLPEWALGYIVNGTTDNLSDGEIGMIKAWLDELPPGCTITPEDGPAFFSFRPAFGKACMCIWTKITWQDDGKG